MIALSYRSITDAVVILSASCCTGVDVEPLKIRAELPPEILGTWKQLDDGRYLHLPESSADFFDYTSQVCYRVEPDSKRALP